MRHHKTRKAHCIETLVKARRAVYTKKKLDRYLDLTTREVQEVERGERKLTSGQIRVWGEKININESWIKECGIWNKGPDSF